MNKDTVVASVIGFGLGLVAAIALWVVPRLLPKAAPATKPTQQETVEASPKTSSNPTQFAISSPQDGEITKNKSIKLEGNAPGTQMVVVSTNTDNTILTPKDTGSFSLNLDLNEGANHIVITSFNKDKQEVKELFVYYFADTI